MALEPAKLSDFQLGERLGTGATAKVFRAVQIASGREVAIKMMEQASQTPELRERFAREALLLADVRSRHVTEIMGFGFDRGQPFLVLELLNGETLDAKLRRDGPIPLSLAVPWVEQLLVGIRDSHLAKVIHRDVKPANLFLHREGNAEIVKIIDFGVARLRETAGQAVLDLTSSSHLIGSLGYMAPEQFQNAKSVDYTADLYAVGVVIFRLLTGRLPFVSRSPEALLRMKTQETAPLISSMPGMVKSSLLDGFAAKAMARAPSERFQSAREMLEQWWNVMASLGRPEEEEEEHTVRRAPPAALLDPVERESAVPPTEVSDPTVPYEQIPLESDLHELPTRSDPNLKSLVEQELALQKARKGR